MAPSKVASWTVVQALGGEPLLFADANAVGIHPDSHASGRSGREDGHQGGLRHAGDGTPGSPRNCGLRWSGASRPWLFV